MENSKAAFDEFDVGESCPPTSPIDDGCCDGDGSNVPAVGSGPMCPFQGHSPLCKVGSEFGDGRGTKNVAVDSDDENDLKSMVVPDSEDDSNNTDLSRSGVRRRLLFRQQDIGGGHVEDSHVREKADENINDDYYATPTEYEKMLGLFFPAFSDLTPKRRKVCFPKCVRNHMNERENSYFPVEEHLTII